MSENNSEIKFTFDAVCFSTNYNNFSSISIMKQYFMSTECSEVNYENDNKVVFKHELIAGNNNIHIECLNTYLEVSPTSKNVKIKEDTDCFIIFFDLENSESLVELSKILKIISDISELDRKIYIISIYTNENNIKSNINEDNAPSFFGRYMLNNYDFYTVNMDSANELAENIDKITKEVLQEKSLICGDSKEFDTDKSKSGCLIV